MHYNLPKVSSGVIKLDGRVDRTEREKIISNYVKGISKAEIEINQDDYFYVYSLLNQCATLAPPPMSGSADFIMTVVDLETNIRRSLGIQQKSAQFITAKLVVKEMQLFQTGAGVQHTLLIVGFGSIKKQSFKQDLYTIPSTKYPSEIDAIYFPPNGVIYYEKKSTSKKSNQHSEYNSIMEKGSDKKRKAADQGKEKSKKNFINRICTAKYGNFYSRYSRYKNFAN